MSYETLKQLLANSRGRRPDSPFAGAMSGLVCGMVSWISVRHNLSSEHSALF